MGGWSICGCTAWNEEVSFNSKHHALTVGGILVVLSGMKSCLNSGLNPEHHSNCNPNPTEIFGGTI